MKKRIKFLLALLLFASTPFMVGATCNNSGSQPKFGNYGEETSSIALGGLLNALGGDAR